MLHACFSMHTTILSDWPTAGYCGGWTYLQKLQLNTQWMCALSMVFRTAKGLLRCWTHWMFNWLDSTWCWLQSTEYTNWSQFSWKKKISHSSFSKRVFSSKVEMNLLGSLNPHERGCLNGMLLSIECIIDISIEKRLWNQFIGSHQIKSKK